MSQETEDNTGKDPVSRRDSLKSVAAVFFAPYLIFRNHPSQARQTPDIYIKSAIPIDNFKWYSPGTRGELFRILYKLVEGYWEETGIDATERIMRFIRPNTPYVGNGLDADGPASGICKAAVKGQILKKGPISGDGWLGNQQYNREETSAVYHTGFVGGGFETIRYQDRIFNRSESGSPLNLYAVSMLRQPDASFGIDTGNRNVALARAVNELHGYVTDLPSGMMRIDYTMYVSRYLEPGFDSDITQGYTEMRVSIDIPRDLSDLGRYISGTRFNDVFVSSPTRILGDVGIDGVRGNVYSWDMMSYISTNLLSWEMPAPKKPSWAE